MGAPFGLEYQALPCEHHKVTHHHPFKYKSKFHESTINSHVFEALHHAFQAVDLNILLAITNILVVAKRRKVSGPRRVYPSIVPINGMALQGWT